jgi:hypothetical protein
MGPCYAPRMAKKGGLLTTTCLTASLISGCTKPDSVAIIKAPVEGVFYTVEVFKTAGPTADTTRVYAHLERNGKARKILVLDGENVTVGKIIWNNPRQATICLDGGITDVFRNEVTLIVGDSVGDSETIHHQLRDCTATTPPSNERYRSIHCRIVAGRAEIPVKSASR